MVPIRNMYKIIFKKTSKIHVEFNQISKKNKYCYRFAKSIIFKTIYLPEIIIYLKEKKMKKSVFLTVKHEIYIYSINTDVVYTVYLF